MRSVIEMAREADKPDETCWLAYEIDFLERFAELVRADERDRAMRENAYVQLEREVCAEDADWCIQNHLEHLIPERIRARGNK